MSKVISNIGLDADLKRESQKLYSDLDMDLSTATTIFKNQSLRVQAFKEFPLSSPEKIPTR